MDRLAREGARFENAFAPTSWTLPSHVTLLTGLSIPAHGVARAVDRIDPARRLLAEHLAAAGYETAGFVSAPFLDRAYGFDRGFSVYTNFALIEEAPGAPSVESHLASHDDETAPQVVDAALSWLEGRDPAGSPFFLFVHFWDVHYDYVPPEPYDALFDPDYAGDLDVRDYELNEAIHAGLPARDIEYLKALYDGEIRWLDSQLERLLDALSRRSDARRTLISLVSDHGDEFFEHRNKGHMHNLYDESVRVPWILRFPGQIRGGTEIGGVASLEDVAPTLLGLMGAPPLAEAGGRNLSQRVREGRSTEAPVLLNLGEAAALRGSTWKVIAIPGRPAAYFDLEIDPGERSPQLARRAAPDRILELRQRMGAEAQRGDLLPSSENQPAEIGPELREKLRRLGYLD
jgi:arylsulfatase A-like enzyme